MVPYCWAAMMVVGRGQEMATMTGEKIGTVNMGLFGYCSLQSVSSAQLVSQVKRDLDSSHLSPTYYLSSPASMNLDDIPSSQTPVLIVLALIVVSLNRFYY